MNEIPAKKHAGMTGLVDVFLLEFRKFWVTRL